jgi:hypothetical protein
VVLICSCKFVYVRWGDFRKENVGSFISSIDYFSVVYQKTASFILLFVLPLHILFHFQK